MFQESYNLLSKARQNEEKIQLGNPTLVSEKQEKQLSIPPPPILLFRGATTMIFKPALFSPANGEKVKWYRLFLRSASLNNVKVRTSDIQFHGTGIEASTKLILFWSMQIVPGVLKIMPDI